MNLFNISENYLQLMNDIEEQNAELTPEQEVLLLINQNELETKCKQYHYIIKNRESDINTIDEEIKRLQSLKKTKTNLISKLKESLIYACETFGVKGKTDNFKLDFDTLKMYTTDRDSVYIDEIIFKEHALNILAEDTLSSTVPYRFNLDINSNLNLTAKLESFLITEGIGYNIEPDMNKTLLKTAIENGNTIPGAIIVTKPSITIK